MKPQASTSQRARSSPLPDRRAPEELLPGPVDLCLIDDRRPPLPEQPIGDSAKQRIRDSRQPADPLPFPVLGKQGILGLDIATESVFARRELHCTPIGMHRKWPKCHGMRQARAAPLKPAASRGMGLNGHQSQPDREVDHLTIPARHLISAALNCIVEAAQRWPETATCSACIIDNQGTR
jgi:hypothetical protein